MVTKITDISKYNALFKKAWEELQARNKFSEEELAYYSNLGDTFTCLEDYFTKIRTMIDVPATETYEATMNYYDRENNKVSTKENPKAGQTVPVHYEFMMLPVEEPRLEINADTREISIPQGFKKLVGVQGDHIAETLMFSIDRFVDYMDLLNTQIYIQWIDENGADRATPVDMIYYDSNSGKILFGWPLSEHVTKKARAINFSVRFFIQDATANADGKKTVHYSFNTKIHQITIAPALQPDLNANIAVENVENYFLNAVQNSPSTNAPPAAIPTFDEPGLDLDAIKDIDDNAYVLKVQAITTDTGYIDYIEWLYVNEEGTTQKSYSTLADGVAEVFELATIPAKLDDRTIYYTSVGDGKYAVYNGDVTPEMTNLYERYYTYTIPSAADNANADITGSYKAYVINRTGSNISKKVSSTACVFPGPGGEAEVYYQTDLLDGIVLAADPKKPEDPAKATLAVNVKVPVAEKTNITYDWQFSNQSGAPEALASDAEISTAASATVTTPGWYRVTATAKRNRKEREISSTICRVTNKAARPTVLTPEKDLDIGTTTNVDLTVELEDYAQPIALHSDEIIYSWEAQNPTDNGEWHVINDSNRALYRVDESSALNTKTLTVYGVDGESFDKIIGYRCAIVNKLNGDTSDIEHSKTFTVR